jgi:hypothetical protein
MVDGDPLEADDPFQALPPVGAPLPPDDELLPPERTWQTLAEEAALADHSYAHQIYLNHRDEEWDATLLPWTRLAAAEQNPNYDAEEAMFEFADSLERPMFLIVKDSRFELIHGLRRCTPIHGLGGRLSWLLGDRQLIAGSIVPPMLVIKSQGRNTQSDLFARIATNAPTMGVVLAAFQADPMMTLHDPEPHHTISSWAVLPIPEKFACLFMKGLSLTEGFRLGCELLRLVPDRFAAEKGIWAGFLRSSVTRRALGDDTSALTTGWVRKDPYASVALTNWYFALVAQVASPFPRNAYAATNQGIPAHAANAYAAPAYAAPAHAAPAHAAPAYAAPAQAANAHAAMAHAADFHAAPAPPVAPAVEEEGAGAPLLHDGGPEADVTMTTIELLQAMTDRLANGSASTRSTTKNYDWVELEYLFPRIGAVQINGSYTGLGAESLPEFFQSLAMARGEKANTRLFAERYRATHYPGGSVEYDFIWTTQLLKDLKSLSLGGDDLMIQYDNRFRGLSVFSLAPVSESSMASGISLRQRMLHFESTEGNHLPADAREMATLSATGGTVPGTRAETQAWLDHVGIMTKMLMGDACPVNRGLDVIRVCLRKPHLFAGWTETEWKAFVWACHMAYRAFMYDATLAPLVQVAADMEARKRPDVRILPEELRHRAPMNMDDQSGRKRQGETQSPPARSTGQFGNPAADSLAAHLSSMLALAKPKTSKILKISVLLPTESDIERIIGPEFLGLCVPQGKPPCWRHHIYGACRDGNSCRWAHAFRTRPSPQLIEGVARRMQQRLSEIIAQHPK